MKEIDQINNSILNDKKDRFAKQIQHQEMFLNSHEQALSQFRENLMNQFQTSMNQYVETQLQQSQEYQKSEQERHQNEMHSTQQDAQNFSNIVQHVINDTSKLVQLSSEGQTETVTQHSEASNQARKLISSDIQELTQQFNSSFQNLDQKVKEINDNSSKQSKAHIQKQIDRNKRFLSSLNSVQNTMIDEQNRSQIELSDQTKQKQDYDLHHYNEMRQMLKQHKGETSKFSSGLQKEIFDFTNHSQKIISGLKQYHPTGRTPVKPRSGNTVAVFDDSADLAVNSEKVNTSASSTSSQSSVTAKPSKRGSSDKENHPAQFAISPQKMKTKKGSSLDKKTMPSRKSHSSRIPLSKSQKDRN